MTNKSAIDLDIDRIEQLIKNSKVLIEESQVKIIYLEESIAEAKKIIKRQSEYLEGFIEELEKIKS